jgi:lysylphosphatidylglycerol synthetase-like protein (DUF2156 family)
MSRSQKTVFAVSLLAIILFAVAPVLSAFAASAIAQFFACPLNGGSPETCLAFGADIGGALHTLFLMHWLAFFTLPIAAVALLIWLVAALVMWLRANAKPKKPTSEKAKPEAAAGRFE